ncbi:hypothetical protein [Anaerocolumna sp. MB42-C2]|uniref:hypothetical protein n=1 Tax=Anaerocolumna sp. MB42-C2 TaxID=3070997 RepID=UPI0027DF874D|nr:hypothetical protein [Anaerocolumna sp. MB42-C2]WMJ89250.1 hypothetical protein RBU59_06920 [Anaerocolumna sp. MB42-C2]
MSKRRMACHEIEPICERELLLIDETKLPEVLTERLNLLEKTNRAYDSAMEKKENARKEVDKALEQADELIAKAKGAGKNTPEQHSFLGFKWTSTGDEIVSLKENLMEMVACGLESAQAQKVLVQVQSALSDSQTSLLEVQETQMAYQHQIADATKFLYGLSAYNMASTQSVLINLEAVLSGASKEKLGEMAQQQLLLAMDQLKNQENIILRIQENRNLIDELSMDLSNHDCRIESNAEKNFDLDRRIDALEKSDKEFHIKEIKQDNFIQGSIEHNKKQDIKIEELVQMHNEQNKLLQNGVERDIKQDELLATHYEKLSEHDKSFEEQRNKISKLELQNGNNTDEIKGLKNSLEQQGQALTEKNTELDKKYADTTQQLKDKLLRFKNIADKDRETIVENISLVSESVNTQISLLKEDLSKVEVDLSHEINSVEEKLINTIAELKEEISDKDKEVYDKYTDLKGRIDRLDVITKKFGWKIGISIVAAGSLILNILQICGII